MHYHFDEDTYGCFQHLELETKMYTIYAVAEPKLRGDIVEEDLKKIEVFRLTKSRFADTMVAFRHTLWEEEVKVLGKEGNWDNKETINKEFQRDDGPNKYVKYLYGKIHVHPAEEL